MTTYFGFMLAVSAWSWLTPWTWHFDTSVLVLMLWVSLLMDSAFRWYRLP